VCRGTLDLPWHLPTFPMATPTVPPAVIDGGCFWPAVFQNNPPYPRSPDRAKTAFLTGHPLLQDTFLFSYIRSPGPLLFYSVARSLPCPDPTSPVSLVRGSDASLSSSQTTRHPFFFQRPDSSGRSLEALYFSYTTFFPHPNTLIVSNDSAESYFFILTSTWYSSFGEQR